MSRRFGESLQHVTDIQPQDFSDDNGSIDLGEFARAHREAHAQRVLAEEGECRAKLAEYNFEVSSEQSFLENSATLDVLQTLERSGAIIRSGAAWSVDRRKLSVLRPGSRRQRGYVTTPLLGRVVPVLEKYASVDSQPSAAETLESVESRAEQMLGLFTQNIENGKWEEAAQLVGSLNPEDDMLAKTDLVEKLHKYFNAIPPKQLEQWSGGVDDDLHEEVFLNIENIALNLTKNLRYNPNNTSYMEKLIVHDEIPAHVHTALRENRQYGEYDDIVDFEYYRILAENVWYRNNAHSEELLKQLYDRVKQIIDAQLVRDKQFRKQLAEEGPDSNEIWVTLEDGTEVLYGERDSADNEAEMDEANVFERNKKIGEFVADNYYGVWMKRTLIQALGDIGSKEAISFLVEAVRQERSTAPLYEQEIITALQHLGTAESARALFELAKSSDEVEKRIALSLLYTLESGKQDVTDAGLVQYLGKQYELAGLTQEDGVGHYVDRITRGGQVGVFSSTDDRFLKYFNLDGLDSDEVQIKAQLLDVTLATLSAPRPHETAAERTEREQLLEKFQEKYSGFFHHEFFANVPVQFKDLTFTEQGQFMELYEVFDTAQKEELTAFCQQFGLNGFRSLLATKFNPGITDKLLKLAAQRDTKKAEHVLEAFALAVTTAEDAELLLHEYFKKSPEASDAQVSGIRKLITTRGVHALEAFLDGKTADAVKNIHKTRDHILFLSAAHREKWKEGEQPELRDIFTEEILNGPEVKKRVFKGKPLGEYLWDDIYAPNYEKYPEDFKKALKDGFMTSLNNPQAEFVMYFDTHDGTESISCFGRIDNRENETHIAAINLNSGEYPGGNFGENLIQTITKKALALNKPVVLECDPASVAASTYINKLGYKANGSFVAPGNVLSLSAHIDTPRFTEAQSESFRAERDRRQHMAQDLDVGLWNAGDLQIEVVAAEEPPTCTPIQQGFELVQFGSKNGKKFYMYERAR